jgi:hypothetical protein
MEPFKETQYFNQWWIKVILFIPLFEALAFLLNDYQKYAEVQQDSIVFLSFVSLIILFLFLCKLRVDVTEQGIQYAFFPFHIKPKVVLWKDVETAIIREYSPMGEYGGWGIRGAKSNKAYNVKGNIGLQLSLKSGKKLLIGTQQPTQLNQYLQYLKAKYQITAIQ